MPKKNTVGLVNWPKLRKYMCNICQATGHFAMEDHCQSLPRKNTVGLVTCPELRK